MGKILILVTIPFLIQYLRGLLKDDDEERHVQSRPIDYDEYFRKRG